ncbi:hypothetical protein PTQ35_01725 [Campylobacter sp. 46490-21]|uniref:hypothetical protein n=1 Tax=Campylobacter magnus TaxID=3026462 RepID=UPI0023600A2E|nr:hypothetical protein [Campylobacter magnus]MDD0847531.1 hypothetical protein [Campylobacter magnus]
MPIFQGSCRRKTVRKILKGDGLSSCDFLLCNPLGATLNAQAEPADKKPIKNK